MVQDEGERMTQGFSFKLSFDDFDLSLLDQPRPGVGSDDFKSKVTGFFVQQFQGFGGRARVVIDDLSQEIEVVWTKEPHWKDPKGISLDLLNDDKIQEALPILRTLYHNDPLDRDVLYRLGLAYNKIGQFDQASLILEKLVALAPGHVHGLVALGVAELSRGNLLIAEEWLGEALKHDPHDRWALRNLAAALMKQHRFDAALPVIRESIGAAPSDIAMMVAYGDCLEELGRGDESVLHYRAAIKTGGPEHVVDLAKSRLSERSAKSLRAAGAIRTDVVQYMREAIERFKTMDSSAIRNLAFEIAILGSQGLNINDPDKTYQIKSWSGDFTGLHLVSVMYAAFQQFAPETELGIDLSQEYRISSQLRA
ncbi:MAG TPA: hypothetical protein DDZ51_04915 [Planctomycetaceae bacterium]|nr:hypothetical protein [Planctomycetaceae bacterium]